MNEASQSWIIQIVNEYESKLIHYTYQFVDLETARDIVQEAFLKLCQQEDQETLKTYVAPWLYRVCRNRALDILKKEKKVGHLDQQHLENTIASDSSPLQALDLEEKNQFIRHLIMNLSSNQQEILKLKFLHNLSYKEISSITGLSVSNVGFQLHNALQKLRNHPKIKNLSP